MSRIILLLITGAVLSACGATTAQTVRATTMSAEQPPTSKAHLIVPRF